MRLSLSFLIVPLLGSPWAAATGAGGCNADNCLRALRNPTRAVAATSFCHSYTAQVITATTSLPTQFATPCGSGPTQSSRLSSACSCYVAPPSCGDTSSDNNNCGTCGHSCASGTTCQSGECKPVTDTCTTYTASCHDVVNGVLASNSIASPQLVDYRIQSAILGLSTPEEFLAALGPNPCDIYTDPTEHDTCLQLVADPQFIAQLTEITNGVLGSLQTCAADFAAGGPDYPIVINGQCPVGPTRRSFGGEYDLTQSMLEAIEYERSTADEPVLGPKKTSSNLLSLVRRQSSTCSQTGQCFERCPDCRDQQTYCGTTATVITTAVCGAVAAVANAGVAVVSAGACGTACAPLGPGAVACAAFCARAAGGLTAVAVGTTCAVVRNAICDPITQRCANCNSANNGICNPGSTQCCAGETGTQCGDGCCCCPLCQAPGGINCACTPAPC